MNKMTNKEAAKRYSEQANNLAKCISQIAEIRNLFKYTSEKMNDPGDPWFLLEEAIVKLGESLASAIVYANEYTNDVE